MIGALARYNFVSNSLLRDTRFGLLVCAGLGWHDHSAENSLHFLPFRFISLKTGTQDQKALSEGQLAGITLGRGSRSCLGGS